MRGGEWKPGRAATLIASHAAPEISHKHAPFKHRSQRSLFTACMLLPFARSCPLLPPPPRTVSVAGVASGPAREVNVTPTGCSAPSYPRSVSGRRPAQKRDTHPPPADTIPTRTHRSR